MWNGLGGAEGVLQMVKKYQDIETNVPITATNGKYSAFSTLLTAEALEAWHTVMDS